MLYLDSSALVKLVYAEAESAVLERYVANATPLIASEIALIELHRVELRQNVDGARAAIDDVERRVSWVALDAPIAQAAGVLEPATLRTLDGSTWPPRSLSATTSKLS